MIGFCFFSFADRTPVSHQDHDQHTEKGSVRPELNEAFLESKLTVDLLFCLKICCVIFSFFFKSVMEVGNQNNVYNY